MIDIMPQRSIVNHRVALFDIREAVSPREVNI